MLLNKVANIPTCSKYISKSKLAVAHCLLNTANISYSKYSVLFEKRNIYITKTKTALDNK
jgi:hypothetical protein